MSVCRAGDKSFGSGRSAQTPRKLRSTWRSECASYWWSIRKLTASRPIGRVVLSTATPWVMRVDPRTGFRTVFSSSQRWSQAAHRSGGAGAAGEGAEAGEPAASRRGGVLPGAADVTDVEAREVR